MVSSSVSPAVSGADDQGSGDRTQRRGDPLPRLTGSWGQEVYSAIIKLDGRIDVAHQDDRSPGELRELSVIGDLVAQVLAIATDSPRLWSGRRLVEWWTGSRVETCWSLLHQAEHRLVGISGHGRSYAAAMQSASAHAQQLATNDPARLQLETLTDVPGSAPA